MLPDLETRLQRHAAQLEGLAPAIDLPEVRSVSVAAAAGGIAVPVHVGHRRAVIALAVLSLVLIAAAATYGLRSATVEEGPRIGKFLELVVDQDGLPFLVYSDQEGDGTTLAKCADRFCESGTVFTRVDGFFSAVLVRDDGRPLVWLDGPDGTELGPWLLDCDNRACSSYATTEIGAMPTQVSDIASSGRTLLIHSDAVGDLVIGTCEDSACTAGMTETVVEDSGYTDQPRAFFDEADRPVLLGLAGSELRLLRCRDTDCATGYDMQVVAVGEFDELTPFDIAIDRRGVPWIVHGRYGVRIVRCGDETCTSSSEIPLGLDQRAWRVAALTGADGLPVFVYNWSEAPSNMVLKVARCLDSECTRGTIATVYEGPETSAFSVALDRSGNPIIAHRSEQSVVATVCGDQGCVDGAVEVVAWDATVPTTTTTTTIPEPPPVAGGWTRLTSLEEAFGQGAQLPQSMEVPGPGAKLTDVIGYQDGQLAVGQLCDGSKCTATAWTSDDGLNWDPHTIDNVGEVAGVVSGRDGFVAAGSVCKGRETARPYIGEPANPMDFDGFDDCTPVVWNSPDGLVWERAELVGCGADAPTRQCTLLQFRVVGGPGGYAFYGVSSDGTRAIIWASRDGRVWHQADLNLDDYASTWPMGTWSVDDRLATVVQTCDEEGSCPKRLWTSDDGLTWVQREDEAIGWLYNENRPVSWSGGALVLGWKPGVGDLEPTVWTSDDGISWRMTPFEGVLADYPPPGNVVFIAEGLFGASSDYDPLEDRNRAFTWTSTDGVSWDPQEWPLDEFPASDGAFLIVPFGDGALVIADAIWTWAPET